MFGVIVLLATFGGAQAALAQAEVPPDVQQRNQQKDQEQQDQQRAWEARGPTHASGLPEYRFMASEARRHAKQTKDPVLKAKWLARADNWDLVARQAEDRAARD
jgi:hypothetical protein